jgi:spore maturation protein CgeB
VFAHHKLTVHVPRRPYAETLRGIPTIRVFEALACGIPLISAPWTDCESLFPPGCFLMASDGSEMSSHMRAVLSDDALAKSLRDTGLKIIRERHSCRHRVSELLEIYGSVRGDVSLAQDPEAA